MEPTDGRSMQEITFSVSPPYPPVSCRGGRCRQSAKRQNLRCCCLYVCAVSTKHEDETSTHNRRMFNAATNNHSIKSIPTDVIIEVNEDEVDDADSHIASTDIRSTTAVTTTSSNSDVEFTTELNDVGSKTPARWTTRKDGTKRDVDNLFRPRKSELFYLAFANDLVDDQDGNEEIDED